MSQTSFQNTTTYEWTLTATEAPAHETADLLQELLWTLETTDGGALQSVEEVYSSNASDVADYELDGVNKPEHLVALKAFSADEAFGQEIRTLLQQEPTLSHWQVSDAKAIELDDWAESWKKHWQPTPVHERLTICPSWTEYTPQHPDEKVMVLDPGLAFGTGTHETTCLMLQGMYQLSKTVDFSKISVLDVGTGSGILAVYAAQLGCRSVIGVDNDAHSLPAAIQNATENKVADACTFSLTPLEDLCHTKHEVVLANIISPVILALLPDMLLRLAPSGHLMLSGLVEKSVPSVKEALQQYGLTQIEQRQLGDWFALDVKAP